MQQVRLSTSAFSARLDAVLHGIAHGLAYVVNPLVLPPVLLALVLWHFGAPFGETVGVLSVMIGCGVLVPLAHVVYLVRSGRVDSVELRDRLDRSGPFLVGMASYLAAAALLVAVSHTMWTLVVALVACCLTNMLVLFLITLRWKISLHTSSAAGFASMLVFVVETAWDELPHLAIEALALTSETAYLAAGLVPLLMWARVRTGAHTKSQVWAGAALGLVLPYAQLTGLYALGAF